MKQLIVIRLDLKLSGEEQIKLAARAAAAGIAGANPSSVKQWQDAGSNVEILYVKNLRDLMFLGMRDGLDNTFTYRQTAKGQEIPAVSIGPAPDEVFGYVAGFEGR